MKQIKNLNDLKSLSEEISKLIEGMYQFMLGIKNPGTEYEVTEFIENDHILSRLFPSFSWHKISELPESDGDYLCKIESPNGFDYIVLNYNQRSNEWWFINCFKLCTESYEINPSSILMWKEIN